MSAVTIHQHFYSAELSYSSPVQNQNADALSGTCRDNSSNPLLTQKASFTESPEHLPDSSHRPAAPHSHRSQSELSRQKQLTAFWLQQATENKQTFAQSQASGSSGSAVRSVSGCNHRCGAPMWSPSIAPCAARWAHSNAALRPAAQQQHRTQQPSNFKGF